MRDIPVEPDALRAVDVIMFFDVRNGRLTGEQQAAVEAWVHSGGHLIIHGGPSWQYAQDYLNAVLPVDLEGTQTITSLTVLGEYLGHPSAELEPGDGEGYLATRSTPRDGASVLLAVENVPLITRKHFGAGTVDFVALDPLTAPLNDYDDTDAIWFELAISVPPRPSWSYDFEDWTAANNAIHIVTGFDLPSAVQMLGFLSGLAGAIALEQNRASTVTKFS